MDLTAHPRFAPPDRIRVWVAVRNRTAAPALRWTVDDAVRTPLALRRLASPRTGDLLSGDPHRVFTGVYEFNGLVPATAHRIEVSAGGETIGLTVRTLPDALPYDALRPFNVLLVSCFHLAEDRAGRAGAVVRDLTGRFRPDLTLLLGDQVYLDLPTLADFRDDMAWLARKFEQDYTANWWGPDGYARVLAAAPSVATPDDHEYWNNFPHPAPVVRNSHTAAGRRRWQHAARALYEAFQRPYPEPLGHAVTFDLPPLSFFVADTRSWRRPDRTRSLGEQALGAIARWVDRAIARRFAGVLVTGQPLVAEPAGRLRGSIVDFTLPDHGDYAAIATELHRLIEAGLDVVCVTGDVHWGRVVRALDRSGRPVLHEVISSPASLVTTVGLDQIAYLRSFTAGLFGRRDDWPRHADPQPPPEHVARETLGKAYTCDSRSAFYQKGDHVALLALQRAGFGVTVRVTYWPIHDRLRGPVDGPTFSLRAA